MCVVLQQLLKSIGDYFFAAFFKGRHANGKGIFQFPYPDAGVVVAAFAKLFDNVPVGFA